MNLENLKNNCIQLKENKFDIKGINYLLRVVGYINATLFRAPGEKIEHGYYHSQIDEARNRQVNRARYFEGLCQKCTLEPYCSRNIGSEEQNYNVYPVIKIQVRDR